MTRQQMQTAVREGIALEICMADGERFNDSDRYQVAAGKTTAIVVGDDDMPHIPPLLTMTGINYLKDNTGPGGRNQTCDRDD